MKDRNLRPCFSLTCFRVKFATSMQPFYSFLYENIFIFVQIYRMRCVGRIGCDCFIDK